LSCANGDLLTHYIDVPDSLHEHPHINRKKVYNGLDIVSPIFVNAVVLDPTLQMLQSAKRIDDHILCVAENLVESFMYPVNR
jgi:hypothetical protein